MFVLATTHAAVEEAGLPEEKQVNREAAAGEEVGSPSKKAWRSRANKAETNVKADVDETAEAVTDPYIGPAFFLYLGLCVNSSHLLFGRRKTMTVGSCMYPNFGSFI